MKIGEILIGTKKEIVEYWETKLNYISAKSPKTDLLIYIRNVSENNTIKNQIQKQLNQDDGIFQICYLECKQEEAYPCIDRNFINKYVKVTDSILSDDNKALEESNSTIEIDQNGKKTWKNKQGQLHRIGGPAIEWPNGTKEWYVNNKLHKEDGPAIVWSNGDKEWWVDGQRHRVNDSAIERTNGDKEWWYKGVRYSKNDYWKLMLELGHTDKEKLNNQIHI